MSFFFLHSCNLISLYLEFQPSSSPYVGLCLSINCPLACLNPRLLCLIPFFLKLNVFIIIKLLQHQVPIGEVDLACVASVSVRFGSKKLQAINEAITPPPFSYFCSRPIFRADKTPKTPFYAGLRSLLHGNACYAG